MATKIVKKKKVKKKLDEQKKELIKLELVKEDPSGIKIHRGYMAYQTKNVDYNPTVKKGWKIVCEYCHDPGDPFNYALKRLKKLQKKDPKGEYKLQYADEFTTYIIKKVEKR